MFEVIDKVYKSNNKEKAYENFFEFVEAIVAYHKYYGGKD
jgi:CRISPR type III-A-associated protein Csm2